MTIKDDITGHFRSAVARYHFHPKVCLTKTDEETWSVAYANKVITKAKVLVGVSRVAFGFFSPEFGKRETNQRLEIESINGRIELLLDWGPHA